MGVLVRIRESVTAFHSSVVCLDKKVFKPKLTRNIS